MVLESVRFYQAVTVGNKPHTFLTVLGNDHSKHPTVPGLKMEWEKGLIRVESSIMEKPVFIPPANIMYFTPLDKNAKL